MSCRPAVMPQTKSYLVRRLDGFEQEVMLLRKATGADCLDKVCKAIGTLEKDYFGLRYLDKNGEYLWANLRNPLQEQLNPSNRPVLDMRVKYFIKPQKILQPVTRLHFYKQLKKDLVQGRLKPTSINRAARLTALIAQIEKGDYRVGVDYHHKVLSQQDNETLEVKVRREHQKIVGTSGEVAIEKFLEEVAQMELYGVELYHVVDGHRTRKVIGVGPECVQIFSSHMEPLKRFTYSSVQYTAFHAKKFTALVSSPANGTSHPEQVDFELPSRSAAQALYRAITEFHTFFKRDAVGRVVKTAGFCKSLLGNFKGQNPDRFYFDVTKTHREVVDHVWSILHPSTRIIQNDNSNTSNNSSSSGLVPPNSRGHHGRSSSSTNPSSSSSTSSRNHSNHHNHHHHHHHHHRHDSSSPHPSQSNPSPSSSTSEISTAAGGPSSNSHEAAPPLPPFNRHGMRGSSGSNSMHRSHSVQDSGLRPPNFTYLPPLPPYSQRSCSSDALIRQSGSSGSRRPHMRTIPTHGPHMASTATFNPYLSPSISETGSDGEDEDLYTGGGSECYVTMSSCSDSQTYFPSTRSDPGTSASLDRRMYRPGHGHSHALNSSINPGSSSIPPSSTSETSGDLYITSGDSECSGASYRVSSPPPLYREVDEEHTVPLNFDSSSSNTTTTGGGEEGPNSASIGLVSPIIPVQGGSETAVFNFDAAAVLTRTRELEGELQRLRTAMTCRLCKQNPIGATFCPCGHTVCCYQCAQSLGTCWECDVAITSVQRMLLTR